jgi:hypothetical protein
MANRIEAARAWQRQVHDDDIGREAAKEIVGGAR